jgi:hypothetical protein
MSLNLSTLLPAKINTSEIATKYDVSSSISAYNPTNYINTNTTTIDGGKITATSLLINNINALGGIIASYLQAGIASIGNTISSNDFLAIGGSGFRLKSNAAGTSSDPTIYGAYIKGGTIEASTFLYKTAAGLPTKQFLTSAYSTYDFVAEGRGYYDGYYMFNLGVYAYNAVTCPTGQRLSQASGNIIEFLARIESPSTNKYDSGELDTFSLLLGDVVLASHSGHTAAGGRLYPGSFNLYGLSIYVDAYTSGPDDSNLYTGYFYISISNSSLPTLSGEGELKLKVTHSYTYNTLTIQPKFTINNF